MIQFLVNQTLRTEHVLDPNLTVLNYLRQHLHKPGTKEGCASGLLRYLPLLLVPPAVGVMVYAADIAADFWAIVGALVLSLLISMAFVGVLMQRLLKNHSHSEERP